MLSSIAPLVVLLCCGAASAAREVTNDDLRQAILGLSHVTKESADRMSGHDRRLQQIQDYLKRSLTGVDRRLNAVDEPLRHLDDRLTKMEASMKSLEKRTNASLEAQIAILSNIQGALQELAFHPGVGGGPGPGEAVAVVPVGQALGEEILAAVQRLEQRVTTVTRDAVEAALRGYRNESMASTRDMITEVGYSTSRQLEYTLGEELRKVLNESSAAAGSPSLQQQLDGLAARAVAASEYAANEAANRVQGEMARLADQISSRVEAAVEKSQAELNKELAVVSSLEGVLVQTGENVMDAKRRIEFGVHQILLEVDNLVKQQSKDLNETLSSRFDDISTDILSHQTENLGNLSTKIETEISQVWRQIGIMYEQLTASRGMLDRLQQQTEIYVNGSLQTMDNMEGKVGQITGRMGEVDENLNYLLGRLSLVTQEFNQIKSGLATALTNIRQSFLELQGQVKDIGPGPNPIPEEPPTAGTW